MSLTEAPRVHQPEKRKTIFDRFPELKGIPDDRFPRNVFIIPDGNGRWASLHNLAVSAGHQKGAEVVAQAFDDFNDLKDYIPAIGAWGFSVDNMNRPKQEVDFLMELFDKAIKKFSPQLIERNNKFVHIGRKDIFEDRPLGATIRETEEKTKDNTGQIVYVAIGFGGEDQELRVAQKIAQHTKQNPDLQVTRGFVESLRDGNGIITPADLLIRSSGEHRLSDLGWIVGKGTELYFDKKFFPSFTTKDFVKAIVDFSKRERRFGGRPSPQTTT